MIKIIHDANPELVDAIIREHGDQFRWVQIDGDDNEAPTAIVIAYDPDSKTMKVVIGFNKTGK